METFSSALSNSWIPESSLHWTIGGAHDNMLSTILMYWWIFELFLKSSSIEEISNKFFDGSQPNSSDRKIFWYLWSLSSVEGCVTIPQVDPSIVIGMNRSSYDSIISFIYGLVRSSHLWIPNFWHWFGFISDFSIIFPKHKSFPNSSVTTSPESIFKEVTPVHIGTFICSTYHGRNGYTVRSSEVNNIGWKLAPKQRVSAWLSISVADSLQITLS